MIVTNNNKPWVPSAQVIQTSILEIKENIVYRGNQKTMQSLSSSFFLLLIVVIYRSEIVQSWELLNWISSTEIQQLNSISRGHTIAKKIGSTFEIFNQEIPDLNTKDRRQKSNNYLVFTVHKDNAIYFKFLQFTERRLNKTNKLKEMISKLRNANNKFNQFCIEI